MRSTADPLIYVISPAGTRLRILVITAPSEKFRPVTMKVAGGKVVVQFEENHPVGSSAAQIFSLVDALSGEKIADYLSTPEIGGAFACYTADGFTFLGSKRGQRTLQHTTPY